MKSFKPVLIGFGVMFLASSVAMSDGGVTVKLLNDTTNNILVTVYDMNANPRQKVLAAEKINGFASISISVNADSDGTGHLMWIATNLDPDNRQCGHNEKSNLGDDDIVHVYANGECGA